ncbi:MAG: hypothetical protein AABZ60_19110 [Planctomycetota bacterium]
MTENRSSDSGTPLEFKEVDTLDPWLFRSYLFLAVFLWIAVFYLTGTKWWNHPLTFLGK